MIRGAMLLALGFSLGYAKALGDQDDIRAGFAEMIELLKEVVAANAAQQDVEDVVEGTAKETPEPDLEEGDDVNE